MGGMDDRAEWKEIKSGKSMLLGLLDGNYDICALFLRGLQKKEASVENTTYTFR